MRILRYMLLGALALSASEIASANPTWRDGLARESSTESGDQWTNGGMFCKRKSDVIRFLRIGFRFMSSSVSPLKLTNEAAHDPTACVVGQFRYFGDREEVGRIARKGSVYVIYRMRVSNGTNELGEHEYTDPYPEYRYIFHTESLK